MMDKYVVNGRVDRWASVQWMGGWIDKWADGWVECIKGQWIIYGCMSIGRVGKVGIWMHGSKDR